MKPNNKSLDRVVKVGTCDVEGCVGEAVAYISLNALQFDSETLAATVIPKSVKVCFPHKSEYMKYQNEMLDKINPERVKQRVAQRSH